MKSFESLLTVDRCRETLLRFWTEQTDVDQAGEGLAIALPLLYPDGWQVQVFVEPISPEQGLLTDKGRTLGWLQDQNVNFEAGQTGELLQEQLETFELIQDGFALQRVIRMPLEGLDIHLFGEALVAIAHLAYRREVHLPVESIADKALQQVLQERDLTPGRNVDLPGAIEKQIRVHYLVETERPVACQVVRRRRAVLPYMEQWGFRWRDLRAAHPNLLRAMIYDPDEQEWDETSLQIGREVCELFAPYFEAERLHDFFEQARHPLAHPPGKHSR